jgi:hypothetical protein
VDDRLPLDETSAGATGAFDQGETMPRVQLQQFVDLARPTATTETGGDAGALSRRRALGLGAALAVGGALAPAAMARDFSPGAAPVRYPEPDVVVLDPRFRAKLGNAPIERLYNGTLWAEGPAWNSVGRYLVWSDIPNNEQLRWLEEDGHVGRRFRSPSAISRARSSATSATAASPSSPMPTRRAAASTRPMTAWSTRTTARSGSPIPATVR